MIYDPKHALELLRIGSGHAGAIFRDGQEEAIRYIVEGRGFNRLSVTGPRRAEKRSAFRRM